MSQPNAPSTASRYGLVAVAGELNAGGKPRGQIVHEHHGGFAVATADVPGHDELRVGIEPNPRPNVASAFGSGFRGRHVLLLGVAKCPRLIDL